MFGSIRLRIAVYAVLIVIAFAALGVWVVREADSDLRGNAETYLSSEAQTIANVTRPLVDLGVTAESFDRLAKELGAGTETRVTIIATDGTVLGDSEADPATMENHLDRPEVQQALATGTGKDERDSATIGDDFSYAARLIERNGQPAVIVRVAQPLAGIDASVSDMTRKIVIAVVIAAAAAAVLSLIIGAAIARPLSRLADAAHAIAAGDFKRRVRPRPAGEVGEVADAFNTMAESVDELVSHVSEEQSRLMAVLNSSSNAFIALDRDGRMALVNQAAEKLLRRSQEELVGEPLAWAMADEQVLDAVRAVREGKTAQPAIIKRGGKTLRLTVTRIVGGGRWVCLLTFRDITEARRVEQTRRDFIANVSHELRTPLASIKAVIETLEDGAIDDRQAALDFLAQADGEVDRLAQMVTELLELSRLESGQVPFKQEPVELGGVLAEAVERMRSLAERQEVALTLDVSADLPVFEGDAERLERAVVNLIDNAVKFTPAGGSVRVAAALEDDAIRVDVTDTGAGIAPEDLPRVFERFYKADRARGNRGTGLGLAIVKHAVEAHGGDVIAESKEGRGSTFSFTIPLPPPTAKNSRK